MRIIFIDNSDFAMFKQFCLTGKIFCEIFVLARSDVVGRNIGKYAVIKFNTGDTVHLDSLRRNFHYHVFTAVFYHHGKQLLEFIGFRCRVLRHNCFSLHKSTNCSDNSDRFSGFFNDITNHRFRRRFSFGSGNSDRDHFLRRITEIRCGHQAQCFSSIFHQNDRDIFVCHFHTFFYNDNTCSLRNRAVDKFVSIHNRTFNGNKHHIFFHFS